MYHVSCLWTIQHTGGSVSAATNRSGALGDAVPGVSPKCGASFGIFCSYSAFAPVPTGQARGSISWLASWLLLGLCSRLDK